MDDETLFSQCLVVHVSGRVISLSVVFYRNLFLYYYYYYYCCYYYYYYFIFLFSYSVAAEGNCLLLLSCLDKSYIVLQVWVASFCPGCSLFVVFFKFWTVGLSSRICDLFIRHSLWTTVALAGFSSRPRPVFSLGQPPLLGF